MNGVAGGRARTNLQRPRLVPLAANGATLLRTALAFTLAAGLLMVFITALLRIYVPTLAHPTAAWIVALRSSFVLPPLLLFTAVVVGVAHVPRPMRIGALVTTLGLTLWMAYELAAVLLAARGTRGLAVELAINALVVAGIAAYLFGGLQEYQILLRAAERDPLTGLLNRAGANRAWDAMPSGTRITLAVIDLNELKALNDRDGHEMGDNLLLACASELMRICSRTGLAARWGGDEFLLALPEHTPEQARKQLEAAAARIPFGIGELPVWAIGVATATTGPALHEALQPADGSMYQHKADQRDLANRPRGRGAPTNEVTT